MCVCVSKASFLAIHTPRGDKNRVIRSHFGILIHTMSYMCCFLLRLLFYLLLCIKYTYLCFFLVNDVNKPTEKL